MAPAQILSGTHLSAEIRETLKLNVARLTSGGRRAPGLATVLVGGDPASQVYVRNKIKACEAVGIASFHYTLDSTVAQSKLVGLIHELNCNSEVDGILVQLPLPKHLAAETILDTILPEKDVDGFHPVNMGNLVLGRPGLWPCTPFGCVKLLESISSDWSGKHAVIVGRSNIVGKPAAMLLLQHKNMTVSICHSKTPNLSEFLKTADVAVVAVGRPEMVRGEWLKPGAVVLDVGINRASDGRLVGDVHFESAQQKAAYITPVPGGVGPMTIAMLLWNTVQAYEARRDSSAG